MESVAGRVERAELDCEESHVVRSVENSDCYMKEHLVGHAHQDIHLQRKQWKFRRCISCENHLKIIMYIDNFNLSYSSIMVWIKTRYFNLLFALYEVYDKILCVTV